MHTELYIEASADRGPRIRAVGGLSARITSPDTVHMIGTAATPLGGDSIVVRIVVGAGARLTVRSVAATLAMPGPVVCESTSEWVFEVAADAHLVFEPEPMVIAADAVHASHTRVCSTSSSKIEVCERVQIGRHEDARGCWSGRMTVDVDGRPLLRHRVELGSGSIGHDQLEASLALSSRLTYPDDRGPDVDPSQRRVRVPLAGGGSLTTVTGSLLSRLHEVGATHACHLHE